MKLLIISGSSRAESQSGRIARLIQKKYVDLDTEIDVLDLADAKIPMWSEDIWSGTWEFDAQWQVCRDQIDEADALVFVVPEWAGMAPPDVKNLLLLCGTGPVFHKAAMIVSVSSGMGGSYPIAELRMSGYKNNHILWIPDHVIIRGCAEFPDADGEDFASVRLDYVMEVLKQYSSRLSGIGQDLVSLGAADHEYGM